MKNIYLKYTLLSVAITSSLLFTACGKKSEPVNEAPETIGLEETVTAITPEQFMTLYEHAKSIYVETPELFTENTDVSIIDFPEISDAEIPVSEAITLNEAMQILQEDNIPKEILEDVAKQLGLTQWDNALTRQDGINYLVSTLMQEDGVAEFSAKQGKVSGHEVSLEATTDSSSSVDSTGVDVKFEEGEYQGTRPEDDGQTSESTSANTELDAAKEKAKEDMKKFYEAGIISKEDYESAMATLNGEKPSLLDQAQQAAQSGSTGSTSSQPLTPEQQAAVDAMTTTGKDTEHRTNIVYGQGDYSGLEHYRIN